MAKLVHYDAVHECCHGDGGGRHCRASVVHCFEDGDGECKGPSQPFPADAERYQSEQTAREAGWQKLGRLWLCPKHRLEAPDAMKTDPRYAAR
jgi:hypothetical protein